MPRMFGPLAVEQAREQLCDILEEEVVGDGETNGPKPLAIDRSNAASSPPPVACHP